MKSLYNSEKLYIETELGVKNSTVSLTVFYLITVLTHQIGFDL